ncbi:MAG: DUF5060 domain-containing protein [Planctomycetota bacterium]
MRRHRPLQRARRSTTLRFETLEPRQLLAGDGLVGEYFNDLNLTQLANTRTDAVVNFPADALGQGAQGLVQADDNYSIRWSGWVNVAQSGQWQFTTFSNDGVRLWVDDVQLINNWNQHPSTRDDGSITLDAGWHPIRMEYFQQDGTTDARLLFSGPSQGEVIIPQASLSTTDPNIGDPIANAGPDRVVVLPTNSVVLEGSASDDGVISDFSWTQVSGPNTATLSDANTEDLTASDLVEGVYEFQLLVTDNELNTDSDRVLVNVVPVGGQGVVSGDLMQWHKVVVDFTGPTSSETATTNPFTDYRLDVTFTHQGNGQSYVVPGFYAADGDAANTGATAGSTWRVHFAPDATGTWAYSASFRAGSDVAVDDSPSAGISAGFFDGAAGSFVVAASDKTGRDFRAPENGLIKNRGDHYLTYASGDVYLKGGPDIPENFFGFDGFDNTPSAGHDFDQHIQDWNPGDPDWDDDDADNIADDGRGIIGALNYIADEGGNSIYFLPMNIGGDAQDTFPTIAEQNKTQYDVSKLAQWEIAMEHATSQGILLHFVLAETESANENYHDNGTLGTERKLYYRELVARFGHHPGLEYNIGEENDYGTSRREQFAAQLKLIDPYDHPVTTHTNNNQYEQFYNPLLGNENFDITSFQGNNSRMSMADLIADWRTRSAATGTPWAISFDEPQKIENDKTDLNDGYPHGRRDKMWPVYMSGGAGFEWYVQQDGGGHSFDQQIDDFRALDVALNWSQYARDFLLELPLMEMAPDHSLGDSAAGENTYVLAKPGEVYAMYNDRNGAGLTLDLSGETGTYEVKWFDPRNGGGLQDGTVQVVTGGGVVALGSAPNSTNEDWAAVVRRQTSDSKNLLFIRGSAGSGGFLEGGADEQLADITNFQAFDGNHGWGTLATTLTSDGFTLTQVIEGTTPDQSGAPVPLATMDLTAYDAIVFGSNNAIYTQADVDAFEQYILGGGSALFISDANFGSDWADASDSDQQFLDLIGVQVHQDQGTYVVGNSSGEILEPNHPIFAGQGPAEVVTQFDGEGVSPFHIDTVIPGVAVTLLAGAEGQTRLNQPPFGNQNQGPSRATDSGDASVIAATYGAGRIVGHYDRNTFFNLNGAGTNITRFDNQQYALNLFNWLVATPNLTGDYNQDNAVDGNDLAIWTEHYESTTDLNADGDVNGSVNGNDFLVWQRGVSATVAAQGAASNIVSAPSSLSPSARLAVVDAAISQLVPNDESSSGTRETITSQPLPSEGLTLPTPLAAILAPQTDDAQPDTDTTAQDQRDSREVEREAWSMAMSSLFDLSRQ